MFLDQECDQLHLALCRSESESCRTENCESKVLHKHAYNVNRSISHLWWWSSMSRLHCDLDLPQPQRHTWAKCHPFVVTDGQWVPLMNCSNRRVRSRTHHGQHTVLFRFLYPLNLETGWNIEQVQTTKCWRFGSIHYTQLIKQTNLGLADNWNICHLLLPSKQLLTQAANHQQQPHVADWPASAVHTYLCLIVCNDCSRKGVRRDPYKTRWSGEVRLVDIGSECRPDNAHSYSSCQFATRNINAGISFWQTCCASFVGEYKKHVRLVAIWHKLQVERSVSDYVYVLLPLSVAGHNRNQGVTSGVDDHYISRWRLGLVHRQWKWSAWVQVKDDQQNCEQAHHSMSQETCERHL